MPGIMTVLLVQYRVDLRSFFLIAVKLSIGYIIERKHTPLSRLSLALRPVASLRAWISGTVLCTHTSCYGHCMIYGYRVPGYRYVWYEGWYPYKPVPGYGTARKVLITLAHTSTESTFRIDRVCVRSCPTK